jgi:tetraacyldisaccharide 4'-kinase
MNRKQAPVRLFLIPFAFIYHLITSVRNRLFDWKLLPSERYPVPVICIGNLSAGGAGKTPLTEYLIRLLKPSCRVATLSRGYRRQTGGFVLVTTNSTVAEAGDEPCQIKCKFPDITVAVDANRRRAMRRLLALPPEERPHVVLLDDAMQHRYVSPSLTILLTAYDHLYYDDRLLPAGNLRESARAAARADIVVVTKCREDVQPATLQAIAKTMSLKANQRLYFSAIAYHRVEPLFPSAAAGRTACSLAEISRGEEILLIAGIAHPQPLIERMKSHTGQIRICTFADHHSFTPSDMRQMDRLFRRMASPTRKIICTEKDAMRLKTAAGLPAEWKPFLYYLPVSVAFLPAGGGAAAFDAEIVQHVTSIMNLQ